jgi:hypothetical protein
MNLLPRRIAVTLLTVVAGATLAIHGAEARQESLALPFAETFSSASLDPAWTNHLSKSNAVEVEQGMVVLSGQPGTRAHLERILGRDLVRASFALKYDSPNATASLFVYWDASNYIQVGANRAGTGRREAREVLGTYPRDRDLGAGPAGQWLWLAVEVAEDCVRWLESTDGNHFTCRHISRRPQRLAGKPALLIIGQDSEGKTFPPPTPWITPPVKDGLSVCRIRDVRVTPLASKAAKATAAERRKLEESEHDGFGEQELAARGDPTFESVSRHYPPLKWSREVVGVKDHPCDVGVAADGSLQFGEDIANYKKPTAFFEVGNYRFGSGKEPSKNLLNGYMPIVVSTDRHDGLEFEQTVFGYTKDFSADEPLFAYIRFRAINPGEAVRSIDLHFRTQPSSSNSPPPSWQLELPGHSQRAVELRVPYAVLESPAEPVPGAEFDSKLAEVVAYWDRLIATGSRFEIPEGRVQDGYRAWIAYSFLNVAKRKDVYEVCDGSGFYGKVYGYSVALYCNNLDLLGYHDLAVRYYDSLLTFMQTNGLLAVNFGDTDTGATLWSMGEHYRITQDAEWLRRMAPKMLAMCNWIVGQRRAVTTGAAGQPSLTKGLIRYRPYADLLHPAADYFSNSYLRKGLAATAAVFAEIGMKEEAARLKQESDEYLRDITASMDAAVFTDHGMKILPAIPDTHELWKESNGSADGYYGIIAPCMLEAGIPAWNDPKAALIVDALERRGGLTAGVCQFHSLVDHAYTYGYWMNCLQRDEVKRVILGLYASMAYGMSRGTYSAVECTAIRTGENYWTLPHTYSNTQQLRLLRNMLLREDGSALWIGQAIPRAWLARGNRMALNDAPTLFGPVTYSLSTKMDGSMQVHLVPPKRSAPEEIVVRLRHPESLKIASVEAKGGERVRFSGDTLRLQHLTDAVDMVVKFR